MATEAARLELRESTGGRRKTVLTLTGLLMEGLEDYFRVARHPERKRAAAANFQG
jgi:hypothetical protein